MAYSLELFAVSIGVGILSGAMINASLGYKVYEKGGLIGGFIVGLLMAIL